MLSVADLIADFDVRVVAGERGLRREIRWVHISELPDPTPWLSGGELLLTTGMKLDGPGGEYVARLADHGLVGLGIGVDTGPGLDAVPEEMATEAERRGFPLFTVPRELPFIALTERAATHIVNEQYALVQRAAAAQERLERIVLSERGLDGLAGSLARLVGGSAVIAARDGALLAGAGSGVEELRGRIGRRDEGDDAIVLRVRSDAWLAASRSNAPLTELDRLVVRQAVTTVALELLRRKVAADTERRLAGDVLASVLSGELDGGELRRRLEPFGLGDRVAALVFNGGSALDEPLAEALREAGVSGFAAPAGALTCAMIAAPDDEAALLELAERVRSRLGAPAGAGRAVPAPEARRTFLEARWALEAMSTVEGRGLATYRDLGSFQLLLSLQDDDALRLFCDSILSPIEEREDGYGGELMRSLEVFIECNGHWEKAARRLYCHRHTLRYRIRRVEELTGRCLDSARDRIDFWLALRARELLH